MGKWRCQATCWNRAPGRAYPLFMAYRPMLGLAVIFAACESPPPIEPPPPVDVSPPTITVLKADRDGDGLIELQVFWYDADGPLLNPPVRLAANGVDLLAAWERRSGDAVSLEIEERVEHLLPGGDNEIVASVEDGSGKLTVDTVRFELPYLTKLGSIAANVESHGPLVACGEANRVFLGGLTGLLSIDAVAMTYQVVTNPHHTFGNSGAEFLTCARDEGALYIANGLQRFDIATHAWSEPKADIEGVAVSLSARRPDQIFVGESFLTIGVYDRSSGTRLKRFKLPGASEIAQDAVIEITPSPGDERIFVTSWTSPTYLFDADWNLVNRLTYSSSSIAVTSDGGRVFGTTLFDPGVVELDPLTGAVLREHDYPGAWHVAVRPDDAVLFITKVVRGVGTNVLVDLRNGGFKEIAHVPSSTWSAGNPAWLPDLKRLVVYRSEETGPDYFDVFLDRS